MPEHPSGAGASGRRAHDAHQSAAVAVAGARIPVAQGRWKLEKELPDILNDATSDLSPRMWQLIRLDDRIAAFDDEFVALARAHEATRRLESVPGIGAINATALVAAVGDGSAFRRCRDMAAWLGGASPSDDWWQTQAARRQQANRYLRNNLVHGARAVLAYPAEGTVG